MNVKFKSNSSIVIKGMEKLKNASIKTQSLMLEIAEDMKSKVDMRFRQSKTPEGEQWEPLKESTISRRRKGSSKPLSDTGALKGSINSKATAKTAIVGTNKKYAAYQQYAVAKGELGETDVEEIVREHIRKRRGRAEKVRTHTRKRKIATPWGDKPGRAFIGFSSSQRRLYAKKIKEYLKGGRNA